MTFEELDKLKFVMYRGYLCKVSGWSYSSVDQIARFTISRLDKGLFLDTRMLASGVEARYISEEMKNLDFGVCRRNQGEGDRPDGVRSLRHDSCGAA